LNSKIVYHNKSNQNQQRIHRGVSIKQQSVLMTRGVPQCFVVFPWCFLGVQVSLGRKVFWGASNRGVLLCSLGIFVGLKHHGTPGRFKA
jgi:hypothetical protein